MKVDYWKLRIILRWAGFTALSYAFIIFLYVIIEYIMSGSISKQTITDVLIMITFFAGFIIIVGLIAYFIIHKKDDPEQLQ